MYQSLKDVLRLELGFSSMLAPDKTNDLHGVHHEASSITTFQRPSANEKFRGSTFSRLQLQGCSVEILASKFWCGEIAVVTGPGALI